MGSPLLTKAAAAAALAALALASAAHAELAQKGTLRVSFSGAISPQRLPRTEPGPVNVSVGGKIATTDRSAPPKLERIRIAVNSNGVIQSKGLATCPLKELKSASAAQ